MQGLPACLPLLYDELIFGHNAAEHAHADGEVLQHAVDEPEAVLLQDRCIAELGFEGACIARGPRLDPLLNRGLVSGVEQVVLREDLDVGFQHLEEVELDIV